MSKELKHGLHEEGGYERQDLGSQAVFAFLMSLIVGGVLVLLLVGGIYRFLDNRQNTRTVRQNPLVNQVETDTRNISPSEITKFPQPRLEQNERVEINNFRLQEEQTLNSYSWVDEKNGVVRIPIERAMQLLAQRGLPTAPKAGTTPPSVVKVVNQAAEHSDTSNKSQPSKK
jgi:hypothetical protein